VLNACPDGDGGSGVDHFLDLFAFAALCPPLYPFLISLLPHFGYFLPPSRLESFVPFSLPMPKLQILIEKWCVSMDWVMTS